MQSRQDAVTIDVDFQPLMAALTAAHTRSTGEKFSIAWERENDCVARYDLPLPPNAEQDEDFFRLAERVTKFLLWSAGGWRLLLAGPENICTRLAADYSPKGRRAFDADLMQRVYGKPMIVERRALSEMPAARDAAMSVGGHLDGCRLGFDLGASDYKISATREGEVVFSEELPWTPRDYTDPEQHFQKLNAGLKQAAAKLPRVDAIGGSTAGVVVANRIMVASLFRAVPAAKYAAAQDIFLRLQKEWQVPMEVANDGDVTALAGAMSLGVKAILGVAMGSSEAAGYLDRRGRLTGRLTELAFAPVDLNPAAPADEWSGDNGVGALYFSQQAVNKLALMAGIVFPPEQSLPERLKNIQTRMAANEDTVRKIYETIGAYLGHAVPWYREFYDFDHLLILGRVTSGQGGEIILDGAKKILRAEYPALAEQVNVFMPDEKARRVGQSVAAASLPQAKRN